jgi:hypothetical protein
VPSRRSSSAEVVLAALGLDLNQDIMAASRFTHAAPEQAQTYSVFIPETGTGVRSDHTSAFASLMGSDYPINVSRTATGTLIDLNIVEGAASPSLKNVQTAADKPFTQYDTVIYPRKHDSDVVWQAQYSQKIEDYWNALSNRQRTIHRCQTAYGFRIFPCADQSHHYRKTRDRIQRVGRHLRTAPPLLRRRPGQKSQETARNGYVSRVLWVRPVGTDQILVAGVWAGNGEVVITLVAPVFAGTPGKPNCHGQSVSALARQFGGLNGSAEALGYASVDALQNAIMEFCGG